MKNILLTDNIKPIEKEMELNHFFSTYIPNTSPLLLGEIQLNFEEYLILNEYFNKNNLSENYFNYPIIFAFLISEFAYWTEDWETSHCFWGSFQKKYNIYFSTKIYDTIKKGFKKLKVISQPKTGYRWVHWCTLQSILGRNALGRLAELVKYLKYHKIDTIEKLRDAFESSYIVDLKLAVLSHLYKIEPLIVLLFIDNLIKGEYQECIYFRKDEKFIDQFDLLLKQKFFYSHIFSSQYEYSKEPKIFFEWNDKCMKCHFFEDAPIKIENDDISTFKGRKIIAKYRNNIRTTKWKKKNLLWAEGFNIFIQSYNQSLDFYSDEDTESKLFKLKLPTLNEKDYWIFNSEGDLLNNQCDEIKIDINKNPFLYFVTDKVNEIEDINIENYCEYENEDGYFIIKFLPTNNSYKENIGTNELIYEIPGSIYFDLISITKNKVDNLSILNELPKIYFAREFFSLYNEVCLGINDKDIIENEKIIDRLIDENSFYVLNLESIYSWRNFERYKIEIFDENLSSIKILEFYYISDLENFQIRPLKENQEVFIKFIKKGYKVNNNFKEYKKDHSFITCASYNTDEIEFAIEHLKKERCFHFKLDLFTPTAIVLYNNSVRHNI